MRKLAPLFLLLLLTGPALALSQGDYLAPGQVDLTRVLPPPPDSASAAGKRDLQGNLDAQKKRTAKTLARAQADALVSIYRFDDVLGPDFTKDKLPKTDAFLAKAWSNAAPLVNAAKDYWHRPRPFLASDKIHAPADMVKGVTGNDGRVSFAYPSGHSSFGVFNAILLAEMVPEKRSALFARGWEYGENRVVGGVHFPTDVEAGRIDAAVIAAAEMQNPSFAADLAEAKAELRAALGLMP